MTELGDVVSRPPDRLPRSRDYQVLDGEQRRHSRQARSFLREPRDRRAFEMTTPRRILTREGPFKDPAKEFRLDRVPVRRTEGVGPLVGATQPEVISGRPDAL